MHETEHIPVLLEEILRVVHPVPGMTLVDATLGGGGYTRAFLPRILPGGRVIALDWDKKAISRFLQLAERETLLKRAIEAKQLIVLHRNFSTLETALKEQKIKTVDAIVADLGVSSDQLMDAQRGLSFQSDGPLDMRLNTEEKVTAADIINQWSEEQLKDTLAIYGDEYEAFRIAEEIVRERAKHPILRTRELATLVTQVVHPKRRQGRIHPATKTFQALRIVVNSELRELELFLPQAVKLLAPEGKLAVVTFHSGEDVIVKQFMRRESQGCTCGLNPCFCGQRTHLTLLTRKPITASLRERVENPRSRSAKLRVAQKNK